MFGTPKDIKNYSAQEILNLIEDKDPRVKVSKEKRLKIIQIIYSVLGYDLSPDLLLALLAEPQAELILATAGGGKTTTSQIKIILEKIFRVNDKGKPLKGNKMLCLVYNRHNVKQMEEKQSQLVTRIYARGVTGIDIDKNVNCATMHSFCDIWKNEYIADMGLLNYKLLSETETNKMLTMVAKVNAKRHEIDERKINISNVASLYNLVKESLIEYDDIDKTNKFKEVGLDKQLVIDIFNAYDRMKITKRSYDFTDMLIAMLQLLRTNESARLYIQNYYDYITADEIQDFTPIMMEILRLVTGDRVPLLCIGDEDQSIYDFRGADIYNTLDFDKKFKDNIILSLGANRRCGEKIIKASKYIIEKNTLRFDKDIFGTNPGGAINYIKYGTQEGEMINVVNRLKQFTDSELGETIICYREKNSSLRLTELLESEGIPFNIISGFSPFSHELYKHMTDVLDMLYMPYDREYQLNLYKVLPFKREDAQKATGYDTRRKQFKQDLDKCHFKDLNFEKYNDSLPFLKCLLKLTEMSKAMDNLTMNEYVPELFNLLKTYYWNWKKMQNDTPEIDGYFEEKVKDFFNVNMTYKEFINYYAKRKDVSRRNQFAKEGVTLSTFHGLKGLEFDNVILVDLDDEIYPNYPMIDSQNYPLDVTRRLKESEVRLFFVALTRARKNLYLYYNESNPSLYVKWLLDWEKGTANINTENLSLKSLDVFDANKNAEKPHNIFETVDSDNEMKISENVNETEDDCDSEIELEIEEDDIVYEEDIAENIEDDNESINSASKENIAFMEDIRNLKPIDVNEDMVEELEVPRFSANSFLDSILENL